MSFSANLSLKQADNDFAYHMIRIALERFQKSVGELNPQERKAALKQARKLHDMEAVVLRSEEARHVVISAEQINQAMTEIQSRFPDQQSFNSVMRDNQLDEDGLTSALYRELMFDAVMRLVASRAPTVSDLDVQIYFHMHPDKFNSPEIRTVRHILITINEDYAENSRQQARERIEVIHQELQQHPERFGALAERHSECPSALKEGLIGDAKPGQLYPELDQVLFQMETGEISTVIESEAGFHILYCEAIKPAHNLDFEQAREKIRGYLQERQENMCQKTWLQQQMEETHG